MTMMTVKPFLRMALSAVASGDVDIVIEKNEQWAFKLSSSSRFLNVRFADIQMFRGVLSLSP